MTEWTAKHGTTDLFAGTTIDEATQQNLLDWFQFRQVCDDDRFGIYFHRLLRAAEWQYNQQLRLESVEWDPMVSDYMERQIRTNDSDSGNSKTTRSGTRNQTSESETTGTGKSETSTTGETNNTSNNESDGTSNTTHTGETEQTQHSSGLTGTTPDTALYPATGYPESLAWVYASGQQEAKSEGTGNDSSTDNTTTHDEGTTTDHGTSSGTANTTDNTTSNTTGTVKDTDNSTEEGTNSNHHTGDTGERYSARHESAHDLMDRARNYIRRTNAFLWLVDMLGAAFFGLVDY